jgi:hypothetical protein
MHMSISPVFWAQQSPPLDLVTDQWKRIRGGSFELFIVLGALTAVTLLVFLWAGFFRKRRRQHARHHGQHHDARPAAASAPPGASEPALMESRSRRKRRRRRRAHRPRNPTLAETGGLPPIRSEQPPEPFP